MSAAENILTAQVEHLLKIQDVFENGGKFWIKGVEFQCEISESEIHLVKCEMLGVSIIYDEIVLREETIDMLNDDIQTGSFNIANIWI